MIEMTAVEVSEIIGLINEEIRKSEGDESRADGLSKAKAIIIEKTGWMPQAYRGGYR